MGQLRLSSIAVINNERSYTNRILQVSMNGIIDVSGKRKRCGSFMLSVHGLIVSLYTELRRLVQ